MENKESGLRHVIIVSDSVRDKEFILSSGCKTLGDWNLEDLKIRDMHIPLSRIKSIVNSADNSPGVMKKFNFYHNKKGTQFAKSGESKGMRFRALYPVIERICSEIGVRLNLNVVQYRLWLVDAMLFEGSTGDPDRNISNALWSGKSFDTTLNVHGRAIVTVSDDFVPKGSSFMSAQRLFPDLRGEDLYRKLCEIDAKDVQKHVDQMIVFDYLIHNKDRHKRNFGFIVSDTGEFEFAPLFDHGFSFLSEFSVEEIEEEGMGLIEGFSPFKSAAIAQLDLVDWANLSEVNWKIAIEDLVAIIERYRDVLGDTRTDIAITILTRRWAYVQTILSKT